MKIWDFEKFGDRDAVIDEYGNRITYKSLIAESKKISNIIGERCLVLILCKNEIGSVIGYASFVNNNIVSLLLSSNIEKESLYNIINIYHPSYLWIPQEQKHELTDYISEEVYCVFNYLLVKTNFSQKYCLSDELCLLLTTSGSTGSPKLVRQSYNNVRSNAESIVQYLELDETERPITTLPMNYTYGLSIINSHFLAGAVLLVTEKSIMQKEFWNFFKAKQATSFGGVPYTYEILDKLRFYRMELPSLRYSTQAGGKLTPELHKKFAEHALKENKKFIVMYGQCEATARMGYLPADKSIEKCGSMGIAIPHGKFKLIDADGNEIKKPFVTGELVYEGANVTLGYAECGEDLLKGDERNGILQTGDMAQFDDDGYYYIVGRKKRFLKIYGNRVNLDEIERLIKSKYENIDCATSGVDDHLYIFTVNVDEKTIREIKEYVAFKTKLNHAAFNVIAVNEIPKSDSGKVLYKELTKYYKK